MQWFLDGVIGDYDSRTSLFSSTSSSLANSVAPGFSFSLANRAGVVKALFDLLANESKLKILSSPQVMVIDNQTANIRVGNQIPVITRSTSSVTDPDAPIVNAGAPPALPAALFCSHWFIDTSFGRSLWTTRKTGSSGPSSRTSPRLRDT